MASTFRDLRTWQEAMELAVATYRFTGKFPKHELYGLVSQLRRSAVSIPSNIAEGKGRHTDRDFISFLYYARGSLLELQTQVLIAQELQYLSKQETVELLELASKVGRSLSGLINALSERAA